MLFTMAEKLIHVAGTYPCQWTYRDRVVSGEMRLEGSQMSAGEMFDAPRTWVEGAGRTYRHANRRILIDDDLAAGTPEGLSPLAHDLTRREMASAASLILS